MPELFEKGSSFQRGRPAKILKRKKTKALLDSKKGRINITEMDIQSSATLGVGRPPNLKLDLKGIGAGDYTESSDSGNNPRDDPAESR